MSFIADIQLMMHGFGDCRRPLRESATLIESIVHQQMTSLLQQAVEVSEMRGGRELGCEDVLFVLRRDKVKLQRLIHYMGVRDEYQRTAAMVSNAPTDVASDLAGGEGEQSQPLTRKKQCIAFLQSIDQFGQYEPVYQHAVPDPAKSERAYRLDTFTKHMSSARYKEYCEARRASFCPRLKVTKFREWLLVDQNADVRLSQAVLEVFNFLGYETVAQVVDLALLVRRDAGGEDLTEPLYRYAPTTSLDPTHPSLLLHGPLAQGSDNTASGGVGGGGAITPDEIREVIRRYFSNNSPLAPFSKVRSPIGNRLLVA